MAQKIAIFRACFTGLPHVYGTRDPRSGKITQVKAPVTDDVLQRHLAGHWHYGVYLLVGDRTRALVVDFDTPDLCPVIDFVDAAARYNLPTYVERSKSKGHHVWVFFNERGVEAYKARLIAHHVLDEIGQQSVEVFPKQDRIDVDNGYGNFIFAPLFADLVPAGRTVFADPKDLTKPHSDQWDLLEHVDRVDEELLDELIALNEIEGARSEREPTSLASAHVVSATCGLPLCMQKILREGVQENQRTSCFRLAVALKRTGMPVDMAIAVLRAWACRNRPIRGKRIITPLEIESQAHAAYKLRYRSFGCEETAMQAYCHPDCPIRSRVNSPLGGPADARGRPSEDSATRSMTMPTLPPNRPVKEFRARNLSLAIWQNEGTREGRPITLHSITLNKRYQDQDSGEWKDSSSFFPDDLPRLRLLLEKAYEHLLLRDVSPTADGAGVPPDYVAAG
ncbi:MAG: hypothetical protein JXQ75_11380 [Phycisphaerae bacterium]|nr:hypothetical protein [Phycisphaerae bacterium]